MATNIPPEIDPRVKERPTKSKLRVFLTEDEKRVLAERMAEKQAELETLEDEKKAITKEYGSKIDLVTGEIRLASNTYRQGWELRDVECSEVWDYPRGTVYVKRLDTGEIIKSRRMSQDEMQGSLLEDAA